MHVFYWHNGNSKNHSFWFVGKKNNFNRVKTDFALQGQLFEHDVVDEKKK